MDIRQLRYFIAIAEEKQITVAAQRLHMTQPPLGQQLKGMEQELGVQLVIRTGKVLELTDAGQALYKHALHLTKLLEESEIEVKEIGSGTRGKLMVGVNTLSCVPLPHILRIFKSRYPSVTYKIQQNESVQLLRLIRERSIELAIVRLPLELSDFEVLKLQSEPFYFVTAKTSLPESQPFTYSDIQHYPLILPSREGLGLYQSIIDQFTERGLHANVIGECSDIVTLLEWVSSGDGTTIVPESILKLHRGYEVQAFAIADSQLTFATGLIWLKDRYLTKTAQHFIELMKEMAYEAKEYRC
ncbi:HTH-type transcriptional regulator BsdA [Paenibacillus baekrokdamisoli]|uniref:HTH-type transcriptional regulator BsdA n=1 Tax=Paenibacillus baekrokdamisoli TaxID=1712516 RepID=A0A3G9J9X9_9BACL|nr:LysR family transcriptional regulator [Paenibacillus baekrokdamisoli]MBB3070735.1 DNA-binding transcriptional LysR family regulator [Paenibacillus baekrokdamisoli]BBH20084.1 HTH-type transcriptional regulator BsdA [Paenibacillus baekrokdamisoli]